MRAVCYDHFGGPEVLILGDLPEPKVGPDSVLVRVVAAGVNPVDIGIREGQLDGLFDAHFPVVPGWDLAGEVVRSGPAASTHAVGDRVVGYARLDSIGPGTCAELVAVPERVLAPAPTSVPLTTAAALPLAGLTALQLVRAVGVGQGDTVLVHGAAGGVGQMTVQLAVLAGARVIGTASMGNHEHLRGLGAEPVEYGAGLADAVRALAPAGIDIALDLHGGDALEVSQALLAPGGELGSIIDAQDVLARGGAYVFVTPSPVDLAELAALVDAGRLAIDIAQVFPLEQTADAHRLVAGGHVRGKVVVAVA
jgi:NADPH:quinone reductase-like Zn-dependent oxidoreductase